MIIEAKLKGNVSRAAHPYGCREMIKLQIDYVRAQGRFEGPKKVLILGASSSYGLASRIVTAFGAGADTIGVSFEKGISDERLATAGWWNNIFFKQEAEKEGLIAKNFIGDAFSKEMLEDVITYIKEEFGGSIDLLVYSLASGIRKDPETGVTYRSAIKPIGEAVRGTNIHLETETLFEQEVQPATEEEIEHTVKVMGGEDWERWVKGLHEAGVLAQSFKTTLYSYIGPEVTQAFYGGGTLGMAKRHAEETAVVLNEYLKERISGEAVICVSKAVTTKASAVIPTFPIYAAALYKVMLAKGLHETPIMHKYRFFREMLYGTGREFDGQGRLRPDYWEMREDVQREVNAQMGRINEENIRELTALDVFQKEFLQLNGFEVEGVDYSEEIDLEELKLLEP
ncbi:enoyl-ACP reductase FabV [Bacillus sp. FJAT-29814]|uniref:enoyl-ACP reductase FabV n=1 Tax=Bacillus sp. FJAT-29814 TaxID=1729688 RepID=UPI00082DA0E7|nr:enoyl-ACP reductase FabV [Bacillus sp. FJAT-29814]